MMNVHDRLLDAACRLFAQRGPLTTIRAICEVAGASVGSLYRLFGSKRGLFEAAVGHRAEDLGEATLRATSSSAPLASVGIDDPVWAGLVAADRFLGTGAVDRAYVHLAEDIRAWAPELSAPGAMWSLRHGSVLAWMLSDVHRQDLRRMLPSLPRSAAPLTTT